MIPVIKIITNSADYVRVFIDEVEVHGLRAVKVDMRAKEIPVVTLEIIAKVETEKHES